MKWMLRNSAPRQEFSGRVFVLATSYAADTSYLDSFDRRRVAYVFGSPRNGQRVEPTMTTQFRLNEIYSAQYRLIQHSSVFSNGRILPGTFKVAPQRPSCDGQWHDFTDANQEQSYSCNFKVGFYRVFIFQRSSAVQTPQFGTLKLSSFRLKSTGMFSCSRRTGANVDQPTILRHTGQGCDHYDAVAASGGCSLRVSSATQERVVMTQSAINECVNLIDYLSNEWPTNYTIKQFQFSSFTQEISQQSFPSR